MEKKRRLSQRYDWRPDRRPPLQMATRLAFLQEAEEDSRRRLGRPLTLEELRRVLERYPGD